MLGAETFELLLDDADVGRVDLGVLEELFGPGVNAAEHAAARLKERFHRVSVLLRHHVVRKRLQRHVRVREGGCVRARTRAITVDNRRRCKRETPEHAKKRCVHDPTMAGARQEERRARSQKRLRTPRRYVCTIPQSLGTSRRCARDPTHAHWCSRDACLVPARSAEAPRPHPQTLARHRLPWPRPRRHHRRHNRHTLTRRRRDPRLRTWSRRGRRHRRRRTSKPLSKQHTHGREAMHR